MADEIVWSEAPNSVIHTAEQLIKQYHPWLTMARIAFVMRSKGQKRGELLIIGSTCKVPAKMQPYLEYDFLIWLSEDAYITMPDAEREALIDHELQHCKLNPETGGWSIREHDVQEFSVIIRRHELWSHDLRQMDKAAEAWRQEGLPSVEIRGAGKVATVSGEQLKQMSEVV